MIWALVLSLVGTGLYFVLRPAPPRAEYPVEALDFGAQRLSTEGEPQELTVTNAGERPMTVTEVVITGLAAGDFVLESESCSGVPVGALETCSLTLHLSPSEMGAREAGLELRGELANSPARLSLVGTGIGPVAGLEPGQLDFGSRGVGTTSDSIVVTVGNRGTAPLKIERLEVTGRAEADFERRSDQCFGQTLSPGSTCTLRIVFKPRAAGERTAELQLHSDAVEKTAAARLAGMGEWTGPALELKVEALDFGARRLAEPSPTRKVELFNRQEGPVGNLRVRLTDRGLGFEIAKETCSKGSLAPGDSCRIEVAFKPTGEGVFQTALEILHPSVEGSLQVELSGRGVEPRLSYSAAQIGFGEVRAGAGREVRTLQLENEGSAPAEISELAITGPDESAFATSSDGCSGQSVPPGEECSVEIVFSPGREGAHRAELASQPAPQDGPQSAALAGMGVAPRLVLDRELLDFGRVPRTTAKDHELVLRNSGTTLLELSELRIAGDGEGEFLVAGGTCSLREGLSVGSDCSLTIRFSPNLDGRRSARLVLAHDGLSGPQEVPLGGVGIPPPIPRLEVDPTHHDFGQQPVGERSAIVSVRFFNPGTGRLEFKSFQLEGAHPGDFYIVPATCDAVPYLVPTAECTLGVRFIPSASGARQARLVVRHTAGGGDRVVELVGEGL